VLVSKYDIVCVHRSLVANLGAANLFLKSHLDVPANRALMEKARYYYIAVSDWGVGFLQSGKGGFL